MEGIVGTTPTVTTFKKNTIQETVLPLNSNDWLKGAQTAVLEKQPPVEFYKKSCSEKLRKINSKTCARASFLMKLQASCNFINKETLAQGFSCEFCEIFKNTFFTEHLWTTASGSGRLSFKSTFSSLLHFPFVFHLIYEYFWNSVLHNNIELT